MTNRLNRIITCLTLLLIFSFFTENVFAVTTSISNLPQSISIEPFTIKVTISGANAGTNYLRIDLYKDSTSNYFGETFNGLGWSSDSDPNQYFSINIESGVDWSGEIQGKIGSPTSSQYLGPGSYKLRVRRYTSSGNYNSAEANNGAVDINIDLILSSPTPESTPADNPIPTETANQSVSPTSISQLTVQPQIYKNVYVSEVMVDPETGSNEWIEIYNANGFEVVLINWYLDDIENSGSTPKQFSLNIPAGSYLSYDLSGSVFNNTGDNVRLLDFNQKEIDSFQYSASEKGKTLARTSFDTDNFCLQSPTKNNPNGNCLNPAEITPKSTSTISPTKILSKTPSPTLTVTLTKSRPTVTPVKISLFTQTQPVVTGTPDETEGEVLGATAENQSGNNGRNRALLSSLSFASFSYSLLSIISVLIKVKMTS